MQKNDASVSRRTFMQAAGSAGSALALGAATATSAVMTPNGAQGQTAKSADKTMGANDRIRVGLIGCGGMGQADVRLPRPLEAA
jgi:anaerobic selenocysteine-containing dehydrogenase